MQQIEYQIKSFLATGSTTFDVLRDKMNEFGEKGWTVFKVDSDVTVETRHLSMDKWEYRYVFWMSRPDPRRTVA